MEFGMANQDFGSSLQSSLRWKIAQSSGRHPTNRNSPTPTGFQVMSPPPPYFLMLVGLWGPKAGKATFCRKMASGRVRVKRMVWESRASMEARRVFEVEDEETGDTVGVRDR
jgi:hypothetical protein